MMASSISSSVPNRVRVISLTFILIAAATGLMVKVVGPSRFAMAVVQSVVAVFQSVVAVFGFLQILLLPAACIALWVIAVRLGRIVQLIEADQYRNGSKRQSWDQQHD
jgi:hypothetical protein